MVAGQRANHVSERAEVDRMIEKIVATFAASKADKDIKHGLVLVREK
jgi:hypothetical protein